VTPSGKPLEALIEKIYEAALEPDSWSAVLGDLSARVGGAACGLSIEHPTASTAGLIFSHGRDPRPLQSYSEYYFSLDPWLPSSLPPPGDPRFGPLPEAEMTRTEFFSDWMRPQDLLPAPGLVTTLHSGTGGSGYSGLNLCARRGSRSLDGTAQELCRVLAPQLRHAVSVTRLVAALKTERQTNQDILDRLPVAAALLNTRGRVVWTNEPWRRLTAEADGISVGRDGPEAATPAETGKLQRSVDEALQAAKAASLTGGDVISLSRPSGRRALTALVFPIPPRSGEVFESEASAGVFVSDPERQVELSIDTLRRLYGLTPAEARLAARLVQGKRLQEAADELGIRINTARHHLKQVFSKSQTDSQSSLIHLLLRSNLFLTPLDP